MFWRTFIFAFLAVGAIAAEKFELSEQYRKSFKSILTTVCKKAGGEAGAADKAEQLTNSLESFYNCVFPLMEFKTLNSEMRAARSNETLDEFSQKYCAKTPELKTCFHTLMDAARPCVECAESQIPLAKNGTDRFFKFICYDDGERMAHFLAEGGPECVQSRTAEINRCADALEKQVESSLENLLSLNLTEKCRKFDGLTTCIFRSLETCESSTLQHVGVSRQILAQGIRVQR